MSENFAAIYRARLAPWMTPDLSMYAGAIGAQIEEIFNLITDVGVDGDPGYVPGWGTLFDVDLCPAEFLPYLGQFVGVGNLIGVDEGAARAAIRSQVAMHRGTPKSIRDAAASTLTGGQHVSLIERYQGDPYQILLITYTSETPSQSQTLAAVLNVKPAGIFLTYLLLAGQTWQALRDEAGGHTWGQVRSEYATWQAARDTLYS